MIFSPGLVASQLSGSVGGTTASRNRGGQYFRARAIPSTVTSTAAQAAKSRLSGRSQAWAGLTDAQRDSWTRWARLNPVINALGRTITLSGHQAYIALNTRLLHAGQSVIANPPIVTAPDALDSLVQSADIGTGTFDLTFAPTPLPTNTALRIRTFVTDSQGIEFVANRLAITEHSAAAQGSPIDHQASTEARWGTLLAGQVVHVSVQTIDFLTGLVSLPLFDRTVVTDTP